MKKTIFLLLLLGTGLLSMANDADRTYIMSKLDIRYVARPNDAAYSPEILNKTQIAAGTEAGAFWTNTVMNGPQRMVRALLRGSSAGGDDEFQSYVANVLRITNKTIMVYLIDDSTGNITISPAAETRYGICTDNRGKSWPCANNNSTGAYGGEIRMGTVYFASERVIQDAYGTVIHELVHTQDYSDGREHMFYANGRYLVYGRDGDHYDVEAVPDLAFTFKEGIANTLSLSYRRSMANHYFQWFAGNGDLMVERTNLSAGHAGGISPDVWLYDQLIAAGVTPYGTGGGYGFFHIRNVPTRFIVHNEMILALIFESYIEHVGKQAFFNALKEINPRMQNVSTSGVALLFQEVCEAALPTGQTLASVSVSSPSAARPWLLALAYADFFTSYSARTKDEFKQIFESFPNMSEWADLYWDGGAKDQVRTSVRMPARPTFGQLTDIAILLGLNRSTP